MNNAAISAGDYVPNNTYYYTVDTYTGNSTWPVQWSYTNIIYKYQVFCPKPRCKGKMWAEVDAIVTCPKCDSKIKVVTEEPDYTVAVDND